MALPANARRTKDVNEVYRRLAKEHGIAQAKASDRLHRLKARAGFRPDSEMIFDLTGGVYDRETLEFLGTLTEGGK